MGFPPKCHKEQLKEIYEIKRLLLLFILYILEWNSGFLGTSLPVFFLLYSSLLLWCWGLVQVLHVDMKLCETGSVLFNDKSTLTLSDAAAWDVLLLGKLSFSLHPCACMDFICVYVFIRHTWQDPDEPLISEDFAEMEPLSKVKVSYVLVLKESVLCEFFILCVISLWSVLLEERCICLSGTGEFGSSGSLWSGGELWSCWIWSFICEASKPAWCQRFVLSCESWAADLAPVYSCYKAHAGCSCSRRHKTDSCETHSTVHTHERIGVHGGAGGGGSRWKTPRQRWEGAAEVESTLYPDLSKTDHFEKSSAGASNADWRSTRKGKRTENLIIWISKTCWFRFIKIDEWWKMRGKDYVTRATVS